jgi:hypothetical protein
MVRGMATLCFIVLFPLFGEDKAIAATISGKLFELEDKQQLVNVAVEIRVFDEDRGVDIRVTDVSNPKNPLPNLLVVLRRDGTFAIEIPETGEPLRLISIRFNRQGKAATQELRRIIVAANQSYVIDVAVPEPPETTVYCPSYPQQYPLMLSDCPRGILRRHRSNH